MVSKFKFFRLCPFFCEKLLHFEGFGQLFNKTRKINNNSTKTGKRFSKSSLVVGHCGGNTWKVAPAFSIASQSWTDNTGCRRLFESVDVVRSLWLKTSRVTMRVRRRRSRSMSRPCGYSILGQFKQQHITQWAKSTANIFLIFQKCVPNFSQFSWFFKTIPQIFTNFS